MTDIRRIDTQEAIARLNDLERAVPIYRAALARIADHCTGEAADIARYALDDAPTRTHRRPLDDH